VTLAQQTDFGSPKKYLAEEIALAPNGFFYFVLV